MLSDNLIVNAYIPSQVSYISDISSNPLISRVQYQQAIDEYYNYSSELSNYSQSDLKVFLISGTINTNKGTFPGHYLILCPPNDDLTLSLKTNAAGNTYFTVSKRCYVLSFWTQKDTSDISNVKYQSVKSSDPLFVALYPTKGIYCLSHFPIFNGDDVINIGSMFNFSCKIENRTVKVDINTTYDGEFRGYTQIYNKQTEQPSEASHIPYKECDDKSGRDFDKNNPYHFEFKIQDYYDKCSDFKNFSKQVFIASSFWSKTDSDSYDEKYWALDLESETFEDDKDDDLFSEKKDYPDAPNIYDFIDTNFPDIRDYVDFSMFDNADSIVDYIVAIFQFLWSCLTGFFKWLWAALVFIFRNLVGFIQYLGAVISWLWECLKIALYNLCVDLRRLIKFLFVPDSEQLNMTIQEKFPALNTLLGYLNSGKYNSNNQNSFFIAGHSFEVDFSSMPDKIKSTLYSFSTICLRFIQIAFIIKQFFRIFGHNVEDNEES